MPIDIKDVDDGLGNLILMRGIVTESEFVEAMQGHLTQDPEKYRRYRFSLTDFSEATELDISSTVIREHSRACLQSTEVNPDALFAVVGPKDLEFGL